MADEKVKKSKTPIGVRVKNFFKDYKSEVKKITWSSKQDVIRNTLVVLVVLVGAGVAIAIVDFALTELLLLLGKIG